MPAIWQGYRHTRFAPLRDGNRKAILLDYALAHSPHPGVFHSLPCAGQIDLKSNPLKASVRTEWNEVFPIVKADPVEKPVAKKGEPAEAVKKLAVHEAATRKNTEALIQSKNARVAAWLLKQAQSLPAHQAGVLVERASELEGKPVSSAGGKIETNFSGVWAWAGKKLEFAKGGIVKVNKTNGGKWIWAKSNSKALIAFVLDAGDTVATARLSTSKEGVLYIIPMKGKQSEARRE